MKYFTPVGRTVGEHIAAKQMDEQLQTWLQANFVKTYQAQACDIRKAVDKGDIKLAHQLAHTLKGNAGQIGENNLRYAAAEAERLLRNGDVPSEDCMSLLEAELNEVLRKYAPLLNVAGKPPQPLDAKEALALLDQLESMLQNKNPECLELLDKIRAVPGADELSRRVENLDFKPALATLAEVKKGCAP
jgi:HPt (histidine-containing phosphotransfer) domain-containing protein